MNRLAVALALLLPPAALAGAEEPVNLAAAGEVQGNRTTGDLSVLFLPDLLPESTPADSPDTVRSATAGPLIQVDLGVAQPVRSVLPTRPRRSPARPWSGA